MSAADSDERQDGDASRRTRLASERTYLAWWRTGLAALAVSVGTGRVVPAIAPGPRWPYTLLGAGFAALGIAFIAYALRRQRRVDRALAAGEYAPPERAWIAGLSALGIVLGVALFAVILAEG